MQVGKTAFREGMNKVQKTAVRVLLWVLTILMCGLIFGFSSQDGDTSMETSGIIAEPIARVISSGMKEMTPSRYAVLLNDVQAVVRKTAHFTEYLVLGGLVYLLHLSYGRKACVISSFVLTTFYAAGDELHQWLGGSRTGMWQDVLLDACGAMVGIQICRTAWMKWKEKKSELAGERQQ